MVILERREGGVVDRDEMQVDGERIRANGKLRRLLYEYTRRAFGMERAGVYGLEMKAWLESVGKEEDGMRNMYELDGVVDYEDKGRVEFVGMMEDKDGKDCKCFLGGADIVELFKWAYRYIMEHEDEFVHNLGKDFYLYRSVDDKNKRRAFGEAEEEYQERQKDIRRKKRKLRQKAKEKALEGGKYVRVSKGVSDEGYIIIGLPEWNCRHRDSKGVDNGKIGEGMVSAGEEHKEEAGGIDDVNRYGL